MFDDTTCLQEAIKKLEQAQDSYSFQTAVNVLENHMKEIGLDSLYLIGLKQRAYYFQNDYSDKDTKSKMMEAKMRVMQYINEMINTDRSENLLPNILENFYLFLENLIERIPHKRGGIQPKQLEGLKVKNEYDVQHLLYAFLKPLYPMARTEVSEDTGYGTVRADILLDLEHTIEVKCTRKGMSLKKLIEEIEADMIHYDAKNIYFFIYDKEKIIENPAIFKKTYENKIAEKQIHIILHQPKLL